MVKFNPNMWKKKKTTTTRDDRNSRLSKYLLMYILLLPPNLRQIFLTTLKYNNYNAGIW